MEEKRIVPMLQSTIVILSAGGVEMIKRIVPMLQSTIVILSAGGVGMILSN